MGGPTLEVFKFGLYLFVPVFALLHFGDPTWYHDHVLPYKDHIFPKDDKLYGNLPTNQNAVREELTRIKAEKMARRLEREKKSSSSSKQQDSTSSESGQGQTTSSWFKSWW